VTRVPARRPVAGQAVRTARLSLQCGAPRERGLPSSPAPGSGTARVPLPSGSPHGPCQEAEWNGRPGSRRRAPTARPGATSAVHGDSAADHGPAPGFPWSGLIAEVRTKVALAAAAVHGIARLDVCGGSGVRGLPVRWSNRGVRRLSGPVALCRDDRATAVGSGSVQFEVRAVLLPALGGALDGVLDLLFRFVPADPDGAFH